ncbi:type 1 glutamine amidotransferase [Lichenifustis flavocetrariae]|uniref:Type 1 glutamine amidotransferase n=1 Tax=Lichenifustis flavocetrariae TaxID=2949735 RepID=A0AA42CLJ9_9HYPH|nr:type 1 glutamine amidotransferase [Lichenifustis flavocetrariae]MCW6507442.1 type 1 glutamine amidotransferase [Lichenifustis flavocetrariae]
MPDSLRLLIAESETVQDRERRRQSTGRSSGESYMATLQTICPNAECELVRPVEPGGNARPAQDLAAYDAVFLTGSPMHVYRETPEVRRQLEFMRAVFEAATPSFGSCAGLQVAVAAAGGTVRECRRGHEVAFARRILRTEAGQTHPLLAGRPSVYDAGAIHSDEVEVLPSEGATLLATNGVTRVQAAEVRFGHGVFWGVQYHPELPLSEIADALRRQGDDLIEQGLARTWTDVEDQASLIEALGREPDRRDLAWRLGVDDQVADPRLRQTELRNFIEHLVLPTRSGRGRG